MSGGDRRGPVLAAAVVLALCVLPIWLVALPPLSDFENHLARAHVLAHLDSPRYAAAYASAWGPYPNLAFDLFTVPLAKGMDVVVAGKLFLTLTVLVFAAGCQALGWAVLGRSSYRAALASFFVLCEPFLLGYCNFAFGVGLALATLALLVRAAKQPVGWGLGLALPLLLSLATAASHAAAIVTLGLATLGLAITQALGRHGLRRAAITCASIAPGALYFGYWLVAFADRGKDRSWASPGTSLRVLAQSILPSYVPKADLALLGLLALAAGAALFALRRELARGHRPMAVAAGLCVLAVFVAPADFAGSYEANGRYALGAWVFALFALPGREASAGGSGAPTAPGTSPLRAAIAVAFLVLGARQLLVARAWLKLGGELEAQRALLQQLPEGARLANVTFLDPKAPRSARLSELALLHAPALAAIDREAVVPTLYAIPGVQPLAHKTPRYDAHRFKSGAGADVDVARIARELDAVWLCRGEEPAASAIRALGPTLGRAGDCELVRIDPR